jgi:transposase
MKLHGNAALSWQGRRRLAQRVVEEGWTLTAAAEAAGVSVRCARKWSARYRLHGELGLRDRSSAPRHVANRTVPERIEAIAKLRRLRFTAAEIAETLGMALLERERGPSPKRRVGRPKQIAPGRNLEANSHPEGSPREITPARDKAAWLDRRKNLSRRAFAEKRGLVRVRNPEDTVCLWCERADVDALFEAGWTLA